jgi:hypothetical protein
MDLLFANNAESTLLAPILAGDLALSVVVADAAKFPAPAAGQVFKATLVRKNTGEKEIVHVTARAANVFTIVRAQEGTVGARPSSPATSSPCGSPRACSTSSTRSRSRARPRGSRAAADITIPEGVGYQRITGVVNINRIHAAEFHDGQLVCLLFKGALTVNHNVAAGGGFSPIFLLGAANLARGVGQTLNLRFDATDNVFYQV